MRVPFLAKASASAAASVGFVGLAWAQRGTGVVDVWIALLGVGWAFALASTWLFGMRFLEASFPAPLLSVMFGSPPHATSDQALLVIGVGGWLAAFLMAGPTRRLINAGADSARHAAIHVVLTRLAWTIPLAVTLAFLISTAPLLTGRFIGERWEVSIDRDSPHLLALIAFAYLSLVTAWVFLRLSLPDFGPAAAKVTPREQGMATAPAGMGRNGNEALAEAAEGDRSAPGTTVEA